MRKAEKIKNLYSDLQRWEDQDYALGLWYANLPQAILKKIETPCWGLESVEEYYDIAL